MSSKDGCLLLDKPAGLSSFQALRDLKSLYLPEKIGHSGTLDPFATGLLIALVGKATRLQQFFMALPKSYEVTAQLGAWSSTGDLEGEIRYTGRFPDLNIPPALGKRRQTPPRFSAVHIKGERAYQRARRGEMFDMPEREVEIFAFNTIWQKDQQAYFHIDCSSGTYIRSLISELGDAYCLALRRTRIGPFSVDNANPHRLIPLADLAQLLFPTHDITKDLAKQITFGKKVQLKSLALDSQVVAGKPFALFSNGVLVALGKAIENTFKPIAVFIQPDHLLFSP